MHDDGKGLAYDSWAPSRLRKLRIGLIQLRIVLRVTAIAESLREGRTVVHAGVVISWLVFHTLLRLPDFK